MTATTPSVADDLDSLIATLSLERKVELLTGHTTFTMTPEPSIGLGEIALSDGPTGVRGLKFTGGRQVSLFPNATLLASAWSEETAELVGGLLAEEAMTQHIHVVLGPTINLHRSLLGGRLFEAYSEDPLLTGKIAAAYVRGLQRRGIGACLKHLVANESETLRNSMNSRLDETTLRELYLLPFEIAVTESQPWSIMAAYNDVNGVAATEQDHVQNGIVKGEWKFDGLIMSDWFATKTAGPAANGGLDLVMPGPDGPWGAVLAAAVRAGEVAESVIDDHLRRILVLARRVGALGEPRDFPAHLPTPDSPIRRAQLTRLAADGMTVLTNNGVLPLADTTSVALIGRHAVETIDMGGGSAQVNPPYQVSAAQGLRELLGDRVTVTDGVEVRHRPVAARPGFVVNPLTGEPGAHVTLTDENGGTLIEYDRPTIMVGLDDDLPRPAARAEFRAKITADGPVEIGVMGIARWEVTAGGEHFSVTVKATSTDPGEAVLRPPAHTITMQAAGELEIVAVADLRPEPGGGAGHELLSFGLLSLIARPAPLPLDTALATAVEAARQADLAVVVVGLTEEQETESVDKTTLALPGDQDALVSAVAAAARRTVVVVNAATPVLMPWLDQVDAVLWAGLPGQEGGHAIAAALTGLIEPAGRLVTTFPTADAATPAWNVTPVEGTVAYTEGTFIGYRGHAAGHAPAPLFWLGHGLGYSTWEYSDVTLTATTPPTLRATVTNTGGRDSREVVQVYFQPEEADQPVRLVGWTAVLVTAGARATVEITADARMWRRWDSTADRWSTLSGRGRLLLARGLGDIRATIEL
ncbi:beta-glucosidase [Nakamurella panacisegetis]|uniref:Beta-glucosidase n=1 Tax=Nakamurella panacisegetis TaxID=1090615 RepID=A0A1H0JCY6_9ACTN|nr:glycoside hydrolase family 3 protein [Nakamurella panacisegetis]SDO41514.1 beta-glucosidase [Nakamurella panacisegetis]